MNVLVVEDSKAIRNLITAYVEEVGHQVIGAESGEVALELFDAGKVDLVLMDIELPGIDGFEVTRRLKARMGNEWTPIVFLSSNTTDQHFITGIGAGGDAYLQKPVNGPVLQAMVRAMGRIANVQEQLVEANKQLERLAHVDVLTDMCNRRGFFNHFEREWARAAREGIPISVVLIDVDSFKTYNDNYGHLEGDECLKAVSKALKGAVLRPADVVARYGGEEFVVLLPNTDILGAAEVAERLRLAVQALKLPHAYSKASQFVSVSLGVACRNESDTKESILQRADTALYQAKDGGRNQVCADTAT